MSDSPSPPPQPPSDDKPAEPAGPALSTPVILALLSLSGVLGTSLLTNWDKIFGRTETRAAAPPAAEAGAAARWHGVWLSAAPQPHAYQPAQRFRLRLELRPFAGALTGQVSDIPDGATSGPAQDLPVLQPGAEALDFQLEQRWCCEQGREQPYQVFYQLRLQPEGLTVTRRNNAPGGGQVERFVLHRS